MSTESEGWRWCAATRCPRAPALRLRVPDVEIEFLDLVQGPQRQALGRDVGDFVLRRADGKHLVVEIKKDLHSPEINADLARLTRGEAAQSLEGRKAVAVGLNFDLHNRYKVGVNYTNFFGGGNLNLMRDRDVLGANFQVIF